MNAPDINAEPCRCAKCGGLLRIVCDTHGEDFLLVTAPLPPQALASPAPVNVARAKAMAPRPVARQTRRREESVRARVRDAVSADAEHPSSTTDISTALGISAQHAAVELSYLARTEQIARVGWGRYVRRQP